MPDETDDNGEDEGSMYDPAKPRVRLAGSSHSNLTGMDEIHVEMPEAAVPFFEAMLNGVRWARVVKGKLVTAPVHKEPPTPVADPPIDACWPQPGREKPVQLRLNLDFDHRDPKEWGADKHKSIYVQHLSGYGDKYDQKVKVFEEAGFCCLRSRRGDDGQYWEIWYLSGAWAAKGPIKDKTTDEIVRWVMGYGPGTIEVAGAHWGLAIDD